MRNLTIKVYEIAKDGLPPADDARDPDDKNRGIHKSLVGRVGFIWDGTILMGWPLGQDGQYWEASENCVYGKFSVVTHWIELPVPAWEIEKGHGS